MGFVGHSSRMQPEEHPGARAHRWRDLEWWQAYQQVLPTKSRVHRGRRPARKGNACKAERMMSKPFKALTQHTCWDKVRPALEAELQGSLPEAPGEHEWRIVAASREFRRAFCRWTAFKKGNVVYTLHACGLGSEGQRQAQRRKVREVVYSTRIQAPMPSLVWYPWRQLHVMCHMHVSVCW